ncbi:transporter gate domain protein [Leptospira interrogans serovar Bataviae str. HAI135]|nr:transporter gate domain protein [Leptospira interrogans serovar Bataviae str. HAI135]
MFLFIGILEETGYIARASFVMDRFMGKFGLSGKSFIPLLSSAACAVPAIMGTRTIENKSDRLTTILVSPLITCSARYPVYILVIGAIFPSKNIWGFFNVQALTMFGLFLLGIIASMLAALVFKKTFLNRILPIFNGTSGLQHSFDQKSDSYCIQKVESVFIYSRTDHSVYFYLTLVFGKLSQNRLLPLSKSYRRRTQKNTNPRILRRT